MFKIRTMNTISPLGTQILEKHGCEVGSQVENPDALLIRSADLHSTEFWPELLCCCIAALPVKQWLETALQKRDAAPARAVLTWGPKLAAMALLACSYCKLVTGSFNPFIYFRF